MKRKTNEEGAANVSDMWQEEGMKWIARAGRRW